MKYKWKTYFTLPFKNKIFQLDLSGDSGCKMFGISLLNITLWFTYGGFLKKDKQGNYTNRGFDIGISIYAKEIRNNKYWQLLKL